MKLKHDVRWSRATSKSSAIFSAAPYGSGHINDTYCAVFDQGGTPVRYILQRINHNIFKNPVALMENVQRVTTHIGAQGRRPAGFQPPRADAGPARDGAPGIATPRATTGAPTSSSRGAQTYDAVESPQQAFEAAKAFGRFQKLLADLPAPRLHDTIPDFHHTPKRFAALEQAIEADAANRADWPSRKSSSPCATRPMTGVLLGGRPARARHAQRHQVQQRHARRRRPAKGICVIDLDTVMPGLALYDFGDMVRTTTSPAKEDERDLSKVTMQFPMFEALVRGYLATAAEFLTPAEKQHLAFSGKLITFEIGIRFLTDFLAGDIYFKVHREGHNLDRCRTQFKLVESIEQQEDRMKKVVETL